VSEASEAEEPGYPRAADLALVPCDVDATTGGMSFELTAPLARPDAALYGGTGAAVTVMAMEAATQRDVLWIVTQFVAQAHVGERIDVTVDPLAMGGRIAQLRVSATVGDRLVFTALGATAHPRPNGLTGQYAAMPAVAPPEDSGPMPFGPRSGEGRELAFGNRLEFREAAYAGERPPGSLALWARLHGAQELTRAGLAFLADVVPMAIARAAGKVGGGFSLDNALRFGDLPPSEWILLDLHGELATNGYGHGSFTAWTREGALVATGSQTASMVHVFDVEQMEQWQARLR
jgi:acyl-CoA thioesterase